MKFSEGGLPEFFLTKIRSKFFSKSPVENISCRVRPGNLRAGHVHPCKSPRAGRLSRGGGATRNDPGVISEPVRGEGLVTGTGGNGLFKSVNGNATEIFSYKGNDYCEAHQIGT